MPNFRKFKVLLSVLAVSLALSFSKCALAEDIILKDLNGQTVNTSDYQGRPVILFFWTTWCPYCRVELKNLNQQYSQISKEGITVIGVDVSEPEAKVKKFFEGYQLNLQILLDKTGSLADKYDLLGVPTYVFLDKTGKVVAQDHSLPEDYKSLLLK